VKAKSATNPRTTARGNTNLMNSRIDSRVIGPKARWGGQQFQLSHREWTMIIYGMVRNWNGADEVIIKLEWGTSTSSR
jgi:hypothetical protein